jgi:hypothetical protein
MMFMALVPLSLPAAKTRHGATVEVTMNDGSQFEGELLAVKADTLLIYDQNGKQGKILELLQIAQVKILKKSKILKGLGIGLGVGLAIGFFNNNVSYSDHDGLSYFLITPVTTLIGFVLGLAASLPQNLSLAGESSGDVQRNLEYLKCYAREQDFEKPAGTQ